MIGAIFTLLSIAFIGIPVLYGYSIELMQRVRRGEKYPLPEWKDVAVKAITGIKYMMTIFVYYIPILIILVPVIIFLIVGIAAGWQFNEILTNAAMTVIIFLVLIPYSLIITLLTPIISAEYALNESMKEGLRIGEVFRHFRQNWEDALVAELICVAVGIAACFGILFFLVGIFFTSFYTLLVRFHLYGQIAAAVEEKKGAQG